MINIIAAIGKNNELGFKNKLIWNIPEDLKFFKETTTDKTVVMGRKTYESIGRGLPNRKNIVLTKQNIKLENVEIIHDINNILKRKEEIFIIGGERIYKQFLPYAENIYLTEIENEYKKANTYFPEFDKTKYDKEIIKNSSYNNLNYSFVRYKRK